MHCKKNGKEDLIEARVKDAFESAARYRAKFIGFMDLHEASLAQKIANSLKKVYDGCNYDIYGGYDGAERVFIGVFPPWSECDRQQFPIAAVAVKWRFSTLSHRDFLGALLGLGIVRNKVGDIIVGSYESTVFVDKSVADFVMQNLRKVGSAGVLCAASENHIVQPNIRFKEIAERLHQNALIV